MANVAGKIGMKFITVVIGIPVGMITKKIVERTWTTARPSRPPRKPSDPNTKWSDALGWATLSALGVAAADLVTRRGARSVWRTLIGSEPPEKTADKKSAKALAGRSSTSA